MKPFKLTEALAGKPVVTRDGRKVTHIVNTGADIKYPVVYVIENHPQSAPFYVTRDGAFSGAFPNSSGSKYDLLMATEKVTKYVNVYETKDGSAIPSGFYDTEETAKTKIIGLYKYLATVPVTFEV